ncbi:MAG: OB-fold nucleic acid binding domain-containing protein [archaeon]
MALLALLISIGGTAGLLFLSLFVEPAQITIGEINPGMAGQRIVVTGIVKGAFFAKNTLFFSLSDGNEVKAVLFSPSNEEISLAKKGKRLKAIGKVAEYRGEMELVAEKISSEEK